ncbi:CLN3 protein, partial [Ostertagia ostertagi]
MVIHDYEGLTGLNGDRYHDLPHSTSLLGYAWLVSLAGCSSSSLNQKSCQLNNLLSSRNAISTWSSGSGMAGFAGTFSYAVLTDDNLLALTPTNAMLVMLVVPISFTFSYYLILVRAPTIPAISVTKPSTWLDFSTPYDRDLTRADSESSAPDKNGRDVNSLEAQNRPLHEQLLVVKSLLKYMIPFGTVYFMQYFIKQGLV